MDLRQKETRHRPSLADPWSTTQRRTKVNERCRRILIDWMVEIIEGYDAEPCILFYAVNYLDRFLCAKAIPAKDLQLLGGVCLLVASKFCENVNFTSEQIATQSMDSVDRVVRMERILLKVLKFELCCATVLTFLNRHPCKTTWYLATASLLSYRMQHGFRLSEIAEAIRFLCRGAPRGGSWTWASVCLSVWERRVFCGSDKYDKVLQLRAKGPPKHQNPWTQSSFMV